MIDFNVLGVVSVTDNSDEENPIVTVLEGFLVNTANEKFEGLDDYLVVPDKPINVYADPAITYFYKFENEEQARELLKDYWSQSND